MATNDQNAPFQPFRRPPVARGYRSDAVNDAEQEQPQGLTMDELRAKIAMMPYNHTKSWSR